MSEVTAKEVKVEKLTVSEAKKDSNLMKKIDQLPKKEQTKWIKTFVSAYNDQVEEGLSNKKAEEYAARTSWDNVPEKYLEEPTKEHGKGKSKKPLAAFKTAYLEDRELLAEAGEEIGTEGVDDFLMWCEASDIEITYQKEKSKI